MNRRNWFSALAGGVAAWLPCGRPSIPPPSSLGGASEARRLLACSRGLEDLATAGPIATLNGIPRDYYSLDVRVINPGSGYGSKPTLILCGGKAK